MLPWELDDLWSALPGNPKACPAHAVTSQLQRDYWIVIGNWCQHKLKQPPEKKIEAARLLFQTELGVISDGIKKPARMAFF